MKQQYSNLYLWNHPEKYRRMEASDIGNNEALICLCEDILKNIRLECENIIDALKVTPNNLELHKEAQKLNRYLLSDEISSISFGGSLTVAKELREKCPKGVFND